MTELDSIDFDELANSPAFAEFSVILNKLTGLAMAINAPGVTKIHIVTKLRADSPLCALIQSKPEGESRCRACDRKFHQRAVSLKRPLIYTCHAGLTDMAIPIFVQGKHVATISSGQILPDPPSTARGDKFLKRLDWLKIPKVRLRKAYFKAPYLPRSEIECVMRLQSLFARQLCESARQIREISARFERDEIRAAREYLAKNFHSGQLQMREVASHAGLSGSHFCSIFNKTVGIHYSHYLQNMRIAEAKRLLSNTNKSISEICHSSGFNSLTHFNRVFRKSENCSPSQFRKKVVQKKYWTTP